MKTRYRYPLEALRLTRQWALDDALAALGEHLARLAARRRDLDALLGQLAQVRADWLAAQAGGAALALGQLDLLARFLADGTRRRLDIEQELAALEAERAAAAARADAARRALDAVEEHREGQQRAYRRACADAELKAADDGWNAQHGRKAQHEFDN